VLNIHQVTNKHQAIARPSHKCSLIFKMTTQILELATVNLKDNITPSDPRILQVFRTCLNELNKGGGRYFRFLTSSPDNKNLEKPIVVMIGIWPTVALHSAFIDSGVLMPLLASLADLISMREVIYLRIPEPQSGSPQEKLLGGDLVTAFFHVNGKEDGGFESAAKGVLGGKEDAVSGWNSTQGESFEKSEQFRKGRLEQDASDVSHEGVWGVLLNKAEGSLVEGIKKATDKNFERVEVLTWDSLDV